MILLTGGAGYIGLHTALELISQGYNVAILDNFSASKPAATGVLRKLVDNLARLECRNRVLESAIAGDFPLFECDISNRPALDAIFSEHSIEAVVHFAALKAVGESMREPLRYYRNNVCGTLTLLEAMAAHGVKRIVFSSTAAVYGEHNAPPYREDMPVGRCSNPYGQTKLAVENMIRDLCASDPVWRACILRYFNAVGAHPCGEIGEDPTLSPPANLLPAIAQVAVGRLPELQIFGDDYNTPDGTGVRDYIHVCDLAKGHVAAVEFLGNVERQGPNCETYNLGTGQGFSVLEMLSAFQRVSGRDIPCRVTARRPGDVPVAFADTGKANRELGWRAELSLDRIVEDVWRFIEKHPQGL